MGKGPRVGKNNFCHLCKRVIPSRKSIFREHNIQGKNWVNSDGKKDKCEGSGMKVAAARELAYAIR